LMPRRRGTRGIQYEALEYLYEHLYEKVSEEQLREHFLQMRGQLQEKGDPVKSAINLAIKELQRLSRQTFELIKIQEATPVGKMRRYVQLNFTGSDAVIGYAELQSYLQDMLSEEELPILRSIFNYYPGVQSVIFPGLQPEWLQKIQAYALISSSQQIDGNNPKTTYYIIPESHCNQNFLLLYESENSRLPFLAFISDIPAAERIEDSRFLIYRGGEKKARLEFYHYIWERQQQTALSLAEAAEIWRAAERSAAAGAVDADALRKGLIALKVREKWQSLLK